METTVRRHTPLIVVASREGTATLIECLRAQGAVVYQTRTPEGCLRVATAVRPDMILLPRGFPRRLVRLLQQHPTSAGARIVWLQRPAMGDALVLADDGVAIAEELARSADQVAAPGHPVQPLQLANLANENVVTDCASAPPRHTAARQVTGHDLARMAGQLAGECLERSGPAHA